MIKLLSISLFTVLTSLFFFHPAAAQFKLAGEVIDVIDGRTVVVALSTGKVNVELQYIDVPEPGQEMHDTVKGHLRELLLGKIVEYRPRGIYKNRTVGFVTANNIDVSQQMLRDGAAWHTPSKLSGQETSEDKLYASIETTAKDEKRGVWAIPGLKPAWEFRAQKAQNTNSAPASVEAQNLPLKFVLDPKKGPWADKNPSMGNVGALVNGYNAATKSGYVGTSLLGVTEYTNGTPAESKLAYDFTYFYREDDKKGRQGFFVVTVLSVSKVARFLKQNDLIVLVDGKKNIVGKAKSKIVNEGGQVRETLSYTVQRSTLYNIVNGKEVNIKVGDLVFFPSQGLQMLLYNLLQVSE